MRAGKGGLACPVLITGNPHPVKRDKLDLSRTPKNGASSILCPVYPDEVVIRPSRILFIS
jgi:hypothetical protein